MSVFTCSSHFLFSSCGQEEQQYRRTVIGQMEDDCAVNNQVLYPLPNDGSGLLIDFLRRRQINDCRNPALLLMATKVPEFFRSRDHIICSQVCRRWWVELNSMENLRRRFSATSAFPARGRARFWQFCLYGEAPIRFRDRRDFIERVQFIRDNVDSIAPHLHAEVKKDVARTFSQHPHFRSASPKYAKDESEWSDGQKSLCDMLLVTLLSGPRPTDYCQGMNYIAALMLTVFKMDPWPATEAFLHLLFTTGLIDNFEAGFATVLAECAKLTKISSAENPCLTQLLESQAMALDTFSFPWFLLLFSYEVQVDTSLQDPLLVVWDQVLLRGKAVLLAVCRAMLAYLEMQLRKFGCQPDQDRLMVLMKKLPCEYFGHFTGNATGILRDCQRYADWDSEGEPCGLPMKALPCPPPVPPWACRREMADAERPRPRLLNVQEKTKRMISSLRSRYYDS